MDGVSGPTAGASGVSGYYNEYATKQAAEKFARLRDIMNSNPITESMAKEYEELIKSINKKDLDPGLGEALDLLIKNLPDPVNARTLKELADTNLGGITFSKLLLKTLNADFLKSATQTIGEGVKDIVQKEFQNHAIVLKKFADHMQKVKNLEKILNEIEKITGEKRAGGMPKNPPLSLEDIPEKLREEILKKIGNELVWDKDNERYKQALSACGGNENHPQFQTILSRLAVPKKKISDLSPHLKNDEILKWAKANAGDGKEYEKLILANFDPKNPPPPTSTAGPDRLVDLLKLRDQLYEEVQGMAPGSVKSSLEELLKRLGGIPGKFEEGKGYEQLPPPAKNRPADFWDKYYGKTVGQDGKVTYGKIDHTHMKNFAYLITDSGEYHRETSMANLLKNAHDAVMSFDAKEQEAFKIKCANHDKILECAMSMTTTIDRAISKAASKVAG